MPAARTREEKRAARCRVTGPDGRQIVQNILSPEEAAKLDPDSKQYKYHENVLRYAGKKIDIRGEYNSQRPPVKTQQEDGQARPPPLKLSDLKLTRILGEGAFGSVGVVKVKARFPKHPGDVPGAQMALKIFKKSELRDGAPSSNVLNKGVPAVNDYMNLERRNLAKTEWNPFIAGLYTCFEDSKNLYQLMELGHLGSLNDLIKDRGALPTSICRFYFANLVRAIEFIHSKDLIHCDLKPDNIVIGADGYLMLCDMGISVYRNEKKSYTAMGTTAYTPPELMRGYIDAEFIESVDWWAAGCILYEMATGRATFRYLKGNTKGLMTDERKIELSRRVALGQWWWPRNAEVDGNLKDLVDRMLHKDLAHRYGALVDIGSEDVRAPLKNKELRAHPFLRSFPWKKMDARTLVTPLASTRMPDLAEQRHIKPLPKRAAVPGLEIVEPSPDLTWEGATTRKEEERAKRDKAKLALRKLNKFKQGFEPAPTLNDKVHLEAQKRVFGSQSSANAEKGSDIASNGKGGSGGGSARRKAVLAVVRRVNENLTASRKPDPEEGSPVPTVPCSSPSEAKKAADDKENKAVGTEAQEATVTEAGRFTAADAQQIVDARAQRFIEEVAASLPKPPTTPKISKRPSIPEGQQKPKSPVTPGSDGSKSDSPATTEPISPASNSSPSKEEEEEKAPLPTTPSVFNMTARQVQRKPTFMLPILPERVLTREFDRVLEVPKGEGGNDAENKEPDASGSANPHLG